MELGGGFVGIGGGFAYVGVGSVDFGGRSVDFGGGSVEIGGGFFWRERGSSPWTLLSVRRIRVSVPVRRGGTF